VKLPYGAKAIADIRKVRDYCLNPDNPRGRHKARVFKTAIGYTSNDAAKLRRRLLQAAEAGDAQQGELDLYGQRYTIDFEIQTEIGQATIRSGWIILRGSRFPRLTTCYVKKRGR